MTFTVRSKRYRLMTGYPDTPEGYKRALELRQKSIVEAREGRFQKEVEITFSRAANNWLSAKEESWSKATRIAYAKYVRLLNEQYGDFRLDEGLMDVRGFLGSHSSEAKYKNSVLAVFHAILSHAKKDGFSVCEGLFEIEKYRVKKKAPQPFTRDERDLILSSLAEKWRPYFTLLAYTGMRPGEVLALTVDDVTVGETSSIFVHKTVSAGEVSGATKTAMSTRKIKTKCDVVRWALSVALKESPSGWLFSNEDGSFISSSRTPVRAAKWREVLKSLSIDYRVAYQLRHTYASIRLSEGAPLLEVAHSLGHSDLQMLSRVYARYI